MPHCNREEFVSVAKPDCRFSHTLAVYLLRGLLFTKTLRLFVNRLGCPGRSTMVESFDQLLGLRLIHAEDAEASHLRA